MIDDAGGIQRPLPDTFNDVAASKDEPAPGLTISGQPAYKACAVSVTPL